MEKPGPKRKLTHDEKLERLDAARKRAKQPRIFVGNSSIAFFDVEHEDSAHLDQLQDTAYPEEYGEPHTDMVSGVAHFKSGRKRSYVTTVSVTSPCVAFLAYIPDKKGRVIRSGVYHSYPLPPTNKQFHADLKNLIDGVYGDGSHGPVHLKFAGLSEKTAGGTHGLPAALIDNIKAVGGGKIKIVGHDLGDEGMRAVETYPYRGLIRTYWREKEIKHLWDYSGEKPSEGRWL